MITPTKQTCVRAALAFLVLGAMPLAGWWRNGVQRCTFDVALTRE
jgi:hypothetical protein